MKENLGEMYMPLICIFQIFSCTQSTITKISRNFIKLKSVKNYLSFGTLRATSACPTSYFIKIFRNIRWKPSN